MFSRINWVQSMFTAVAENKKWHEPPLLLCIQGYIQRSKETSINKYPVDSIPFASLAKLICDEV